MRLRACGLASALWLGAWGAEAADSPRNHAGWWIQTFGVLEANEDARVADAQRIFERMVAVADKRTSRYPRLLVVREPAGPLGLALPDGTLVLTRASLDTCFRGSSATAGQARLAFVIGHELAHLAHDDFWHAFAADALREFARDPRLERDLQPLLAEQPDEARTKELQADSYGMLYLVMAGYDPAAIVRADAGFLDAWVGREAAGAESSHPTPRERVGLIRTFLTSVAEQADLFQFGVRLYELGRYDDARLLLESYGERFAGREVLNNLGLVHYQLAVASLAGCSPREATRFLLPTRLDPVTLVRPPVLRSGSPCREQAPFQRSSLEAVRLLEAATERDPDYLPARINLASALILRGEYARAHWAAEEALKVAPADRGAQEAKALALYLFGAQAQIETADAALALLSSLRTQGPDDASVHYNLAAIASERVRGAAATEGWEAFLRLEGEGPFADAARLRLGRTVVTPPAPVAPKVQSRPPVALGPLDGRSRAALSSMSRHPFELGSLQGAVYRGARLRVLQLASNIELVEEEPGNLLPSSRLLASHGRPLRIVDLDGRRLLVFPGLACEEVNGLVTRRLYFAP